MKNHLRSIMGSDYKGISIVFSIVFAIISAFSVCIFFHMRNYAEVITYFTDSRFSMIRDIFSNPSYLLFLLPIPVFTAIYVFCFNEKTDFHISELICGLIFAFYIIVSLSMEHSDLREIFLPLKAKGFDLICGIAAFLGFFLICFFCVHILYILLTKKCDHLANLAGTNEKKKQFLFFILAFVLIGACWVPIFIMCYPCTMFSDTLTQISSYLGERKIDASHPILTTYFYGFVFSLGRNLVDDSFACFLCSFSQSFINCLIMALVAVKVRSYTKSNVFFFLTVLFYGVCPTWAKAAQQALKDVLHTGCFLLFFLQFLECLKEERTDFKSILWLWFCAVLVAFTRKATFWLAVLCIIIIILLHWKKYWLKYGICLALFMSLFFYCEKVLYPSMGITQPRESENYSLQLQQTALYCRTHLNELTAEEKKIINRTLNLDTIVANYTPLISDPVKSTFHGKKEDHDAFWDLYFTFMKRDPLLFAKATIMNSFEHMNPWYYHGGGVYIQTKPGFFEVTFRSNAVWKLNAYWKSWGDIPIARTLRSTGLYAWILLAMIGFCSTKKSWKGVLGTFPSLVLLIGLFFSHVNGEIRYGYPLVAATPIIIAFTVYSVSQDGIKRVKKKVKAAPKAEPHKLQWLYTFNEKPAVPLPETDQAPVENQEQPIAPAEVEDEEEFLNPKVKQMKRKATLTAARWLEKQAQKIIEKNTDDDE